jgi:CheY-like chemotaxis protein
MTTRTDILSPSGKKKFEFFIADSTHESKANRGGNEIQAAGHTFVGHTGPFDCSIGNIFQEDFTVPQSFDMVVHNKRDNALSVLIVDDSVIHRKITMKALGGLIDEVMWMVDSAENGESAMSFVQKTKIPDVIIIDQNMESTGGRMLGHQVVELLKQDPAFDHVVIIGCTGMSEIAHRDLMRAGCDAVWSKPMPSRNEAQAQIFRFLELKRNQALEQQVKQSTDNLALSSVTYSHRRGGATEDSFPVFQQVKMARVAYKPSPWEAVMDCSYNRRHPGGDRLIENDSSWRQEKEVEVDGGVVSVQQGMDTLWLRDQLQDNAGVPESISLPSSMRLT